MKDVSELKSICFVLLEYPGSVPNNSMATQNQTPVLGDLKLSSGLCGHRHECGEEKYVQAKHSRAWEEKKAVLVGLIVSAFLGHKKVYPVSSRAKSQGFPNTAICLSRSFPQLSLS